MVSNEEIQQSVAGQTVPNRFVETVSAHGDQVALRWRNEDGSWGERTFSDYADQVARAAAGMQAMGVTPGQRIVLMMRNIPEFHVLDMAAYFCGATSISIYNSSSPEQIQYLVDHCGAGFGVFEDASFLTRLQEVKDDLPALQHVGVLDAEGASGHDFTYDDLVGHDPIDLDQAAIGRPARRSRHDHLHLRDHRPTQGCDAHPLQRGVDGREPVPLHRHRRSRRDASRLLPTDGPHRRAGLEPLSTGLPRHRSHVLPRPGTDRPLRP